MSVYLIEAVGTGRVKIGYGDDPARRIQSIATCCPFPIVVLAVRDGSMALERAMHRGMAERRVHLEWFQKWDDAVRWFHSVPEPSADTPLQSVMRALDGNQSELARICGVSQPTVWGWLNKGRGILPAEHCLKVEAATGISRHELRPDVFGPADEQAAA